MAGKGHSFVVVIVLTFALMAFMFLVPSSVHTQDSEIAPLSSALHVLPPVGAKGGPNTGEIRNFDKTLTEYLTVSVWQVIGDDDYVQVAEFTSEKTGRGSRYLKLQETQYRVNWRIRNGNKDNEYLIHFTVADLNIGYVTYVPKVRPARNSTTSLLSSERTVSSRGKLWRRTVPIKFRIDNHPAIRARVLNEQGFSALEVAWVLVNEFQLGSSDVAQILTDEGYDVIEIGEILRDVFGTGPQEVAQILSNTGSYSATEIAQVLIDVFGLGDDALEVAGILKDLGFTASQIQDALKETLGLDVAEIVNILETLGFTVEELFAAASRELAERFAPQLRFSKLGGSYPMSAQEYFEGSIEADGGRLENRDPDTFTTPGQEPPTYFKAFLVGNQIRILYWWYYGYQSGCPTPIGKQGIHDGDWERVMVILSEDSSEVAAVTFWQHGGWYTRLAKGADTTRMGGIGASYDPGVGFEGTHPIVYVGAHQHGSYHNDGGYVLEFQCGYFGDVRDDKYRLNTQNNLVSLADFEEAWMNEEATATLSFEGDGTTASFDLGSKYVIATSVQIKVNGVVSDQATWTFSNDGGADEVDQIVFSAAPENGAEILVDLEKGDFRWGCGPCEEDGISTHPIKASTSESMSTLDSCKGLDATIFGETRGCFESQCEFHDDQAWWTDFHPGRCSHCPTGYMDMGTYCWKTGWPWEWRFTDIHYYGLKYTLSQTDFGLTRSR